MSFYFTFTSPTDFNKESKKLLEYESLIQQHSDEHANH